MTTSKIRGHEIIVINGKWRYADTKEDIARTWRDRPCGHCHKDTVDRHDACIAGLPGVLNACCGHGVPEDAYVQFDDCICVRGEAATAFFHEIRRHND